MRVLSCAADGYAVRPPSCPTPWMKRIAFVTDHNWPDLVDDDVPVVKELERRGHAVDAAIWNDPALDWQRYDAVMLRSCWDYHTAPEAFAAWIDRLAAAEVPLWNPAA